VTVRDLEPGDVARLLSEKAILLVDVREAGEFAAERIDGATLLPLSAFDPLALPDAENRQIVFHCGSGMRSAKAVAACQAAGLSHDAHLKGGIQAWTAAGLPTITTDPATGNPRK
jgi:rhodanese-related sulfurtransferase